MFTYSPREFSISRNQKRRFGFGVGFISAGAGMVVYVGIGFRLWSSRFDKTKMKKINLGKVRAG